MRGRTCKILHLEEILHTRCPSSLEAKTKKNIKFKRRVHLEALMWFEASSHEGQVGAKKNRIMASMWTLLLHKEMGDFSWAWK